LGEVCGSRAAALGDRPCHRQERTGTALHPRGGIGPGQAKLPVAVRAGATTGIPFGEPASSSSITTSASSLQGWENAAIERSLSGV
jgi:hypothetical protein